MAGGGTGGGSPPPARPLVGDRRPGVALRVVRDPVDPLDDVRVGAGPVDQDAHRVQATLTRAAERRPADGPRDVRAATDVIANAVPGGGEALAHASGELGMAD